MAHRGQFAPGRRKTASVCSSVWILKQEMRAVPCGILLLAAPSFLARGMERVAWNAIPSKVCGCGGLEFSLILDQARVFWLGGLWSVARLPRMLPGTSKTRNRGELPILADVTGFTAFQAAVHALQKGDAEKALQMLHKATVGLSQH